ncbi:hypothetical protein HNV11_10620 [Spirosoma taeanense]|uniref:Uncharacterized protein n=1 Tax=Spirosoma taeanense TaxID=2735870 RepID=A0A6M5Y5Q3_9BACT|nr:hypothetical protein [Spirosoma taeanense]QJW89798.1 hypothetical protein HNV11_10620 [Spirosoma taeanense]
MTFSLIHEAPYISAGQDTLPILLNFSNQGPRPRKVRLTLFSIPGGFRLTQLHPVLTVSARTDTILTLTCLVGRSVQWDRTYDLAIEAQELLPGDVAGLLLGSIVCRPVLLSSTKRLTEKRQNDLAAGGIALSLSRFGAAGMVREVRAWGQEDLVKGSLTYQAHYLNYIGQRYHELRDTYLQYQQSDFQLRVGSLFDYHELALIGVGVKFSHMLGESTRLEGWALRNQSNWLANLPGINQSVPGLSQSGVDQTYSLRLSGRIPLSGVAVYEASSSYYRQQRYNRAGVLNFATALWQPDKRTKFRLMAGQSIEASPGQANRQQTVGWALAGGYERTGEILEIRASANFSSPVYGGIQRGAALIDQSLTYKKWRTTQLAYRFSQVQYDQRIYTAAKEVSRQRYGNTIAEMTMAQQFNRLTWLLRPYFWIQQQSLPGSAMQRSESYRLLTSLRLETQRGVRLEAGVDAGLVNGVAPPTDRFKQPSFRYYGSLGINRLNLAGFYQRGVFLINDRLPGRGSPGAYRQISISPSWQVRLLDNRLLLNVGGGLTFNSITRSWSGLSYNSITYAMKDNLLVRFEANLLSYANQFADIAAVPWQDSQLRFEVTKLFKRSPFKTSRTLRLRFFEDQNANQMKDGDENYLDGLIVNVGTATLITDKKGAVICKDIAPGLHQVRTVSKLATGEPVWFQDTLRVGKSMQRDIAIRKTWRVSGQLHYNRVKYESLPYDLEQHRIETFGQSGEVYRTYADAQGNFTLYLPVGQYQLEIVPVQTPSVRKTVAYRVDPDNAPTKLNIELEPNGRPVRVKRFSSR